MSGFFAATVLALAFYLFLSFGSGTDIFYWSYMEAGLGVLFAVLSGVFAQRVFNGLGIKPTNKCFNPKRWLLFAIYVFGPFLFALTKANLDVAYRVLTGKIKPGIVRIKPGLKSSFATTLLANSITLTPGTLTVDIGKDNELFVHWINVEDKEPKAELVCGSFAEWARRIAE